MYTVGFLAMAITMSCSLVTILVSLRKISKENTKEKIENAIWRRDVDSNLSRAVCSLEKAVGRMDANDIEHHEFREWQIRAESRSDKIEAKANRALGYIDEIRAKK